MGERKSGKKRGYNRTAVGGTLMVIGMVLLVLITVMDLGQAWYVVAGALAGLGFGNLVSGLRHRGKDEEHDLRR